MAENATTARGHPADVTKRDCLKLVSGSAAAIGGGAITWSPVDSMNSPADVQALSSLDVDPKPIGIGSGITVLRQGKPIFVRHRTPHEIEAAQDVQLSALSGPQTDIDREKPGHAECIVLAGICPHLGCVPLGNETTDPRGGWDGWFRPCHGSQYDASGRVRRGPAAANPAVPPYTFDDNTKITIG